VSLAALPALALPQHVAADDGEPARLGVPLEFVADLRYGHRVAGTAEVEVRPGQEGNALERQLARGVLESRELVGILVLAGRLKVEDHPLQGDTGHAVDLVAVLEAPDDAHRGDVGDVDRREHDGEDGDGHEDLDEGEAAGRSDALQAGYRVQGAGYRVKSRSPFFSPFHKGGHRGFEALQIHSFRLFACPLSCSALLRFRSSYLPVFKLAGLYRMILQGRFG
jgi:hypothetical protein